jgi:hypothetical protein
VAPEVSCANYCNITCHVLLVYLDLVVLCSIVIRESSFFLVKLCFYWFIYVRVLSLGILGLYCFIFLLVNLEFI